MIINECCVYGIILVTLWILAGLQSAMNEAGEHNDVKLVTQLNKYMFVNEYMLQIAS